MEAALTVYELLPSAHELPSISNDHLAQYEAGLAAFRAGDWPTAHWLLQELPDTDRAREFLMDYIVQQGFAPAPDWDGFVTLTSKS
jgi:adenylate cyclase